MSPPGGVSDTPPVVEFHTTFTGGLSAPSPTRAWGSRAFDGLSLSELHRANGRWQSAMERLMTAAEDPSAEALDCAARQFSIALRAEGLTQIRPSGKRRRG
jgi:hypothetical protein